GSCRRADVGAELAGVGEVQVAHRRGHHQDVAGTQLAGEDEVASVGLEARWPAVFDRRVEVRFAHVTDVGDLRPPGLATAAASAGQTWEGYGVTVRHPSIASSTAVADSTVFLGSTRLQSTMPTRAVTTKP